MTVLHMDSSDLKSQYCAQITALLPEWFGVAEANEKYIRNIKDKEVWSYHVDDRAVGLIAVKFHFDKTAEVWWFGVEAGFHGQGIGKQLMAHAEAAAREKGCTRMVLYTLSDKSPCEHYAKTRKFYERYGFEPFIEFTEEGNDNPLQWMIKDLK